MTVAVDKDVLSEYIEVVEKAGLYPMKVETPSICLLRYSEKEEGGVLVIYKNFKETILVISEGKKIVGTSIQLAENFGDVLKSASKMLNHYSGAGQWGTALACAARITGLSATVYWVRAVYKWKDARRDFMKLYGAEVHASPRKIPRRAEGY